MITQIATCSVCHAEWRVDTPYGLEPESECDCPHCPHCPPVRPVKTEKGWAITDSLPGRVL